jgi:type IV secretory pathway TrbD component
MLLSHGIFMNNNWRPEETGLGWTWTWLDNIVGALVVFVPPVSIEDRPLLWMTSHRPIILYTYLLIGVGSLIILLSWDPALFGLTVKDWLLDRRSKHRIEAEPQVLGAWSPSLDGDLDPLTGVERVGLVCTWGTNKVCVSGYPAGLHWFVNHRFYVTVRLGYDLAP